VSDLLLNLTPTAAAAALGDWLRDRGEPAYRVRQIVPRLWQRPVAAWSEATDLPVGLRRELDAAWPLPRPVQRARQTSHDGTIKFLWEFPAGDAVESVLILEGRRRTLCISSQAGCAFGCVFCATGRMGFVRHLAPWEITAQVRELALDPELNMPTNVVFMGMGEPLHNWDAVDRALTILNAPEGFGIGARHITVSTVGLVPALEQLAARREQFRVALSLHAADPATRRSLMPVEGKYPLADVMAVLRQFPKRVTLEYVMIEGINDRDSDLRELTQVARSSGALVNLLPLHPGGAPGYRPTPPARIAAFAAGLEAHGISATIRRSRGLDISAACGQLRLETDEVRGVSPEVDAHVEE